MFVQKFLIHLRTAYAPDSHDEFCEVCAANGMVDLYVNLVKAMADCIPDMLQFEVCTSSSSLFTLIYIYSIFVGGIAMYSELHS